MSYIHSKFIKIFKNTFLIKESVYAGFSVFIIYKIFTVYTKKSCKYGNRNTPTCCGMLSYLRLLNTDIKMRTAGYVDQFDYLFLPAASMAVHACMTS